MIMTFNCRSLVLGLFVLFYSFTCAAAQESVKTNPLISEQKKQFDSIPEFKNRPNTGSETDKEDNLAFLSRKSKTEKHQEKINIRSREWGFYAGSFTFHKDLKGESQKAPVVLFGIRHAWSIKNNPAHRFRYYVDLNPLIIVNYRERREVRTSPTTTAIVGDRKTVFGVGFVPFGLQFNWRNSKKFQPYIAGGMGVAIFNKRFPDNRSPLNPDRIGNRFQIMPEFGAGVEIRQSESRSYFIGYKYHHMSNGYTAPLNVGYNTNMIYFGAYLQRKK